MPRFIILFVVFFISLPFHGAQAQRANDSCQSITNFVERKLCQSSLLRYKNQLLQQLLKKYKKGLKNTVGIPQIDEQQESWSVLLLSCQSKDKPLACLKQRYQARSARIAFNIAKQQSRWMEGTAQECLKLSADTTLGEGCLTLYLKALDQRKQKLINRIKNEIYWGPQVALGMDYQKMPSHEKASTHKNSHETFAHTEKQKVIASNKAFEAYRKNTCVLVSSLVLEAQTVAQSLCQVRRTEDYIRALEAGLH